MAIPKESDKKTGASEELEVLTSVKEAAPLAEAVLAPPVVETVPVVEVAPEPKIDLNTFLRLRQVFDIAYLSGVLGSYGKYPRTTTEWDLLLEAIVG